MPTTLQSFVTHFVDRSIIVGMKNGEEVRTTYREWEETGKEAAYYRIPQAEDSLMSKEDIEKLNLAIQGLQSEINSLRKELALQKKK